MAAGDSLHNYKYCTKTRTIDPVPNDVIYEQGSRPLTAFEKGKKGGDVTADLWKVSLDLAAEGKLGTSSFTHHRANQYGVFRTHVSYLNEHYL